MASKTLLIASIAVLGAFACSRAAKQSRVDDNMTTNSPITLQVTNDNQQDVDVFLNNGERRRLGMVTSGQTQTFTVAASAAHSAGGLRVIVHPIGGGGDFSTGPLTISPGDQLDLRVAPVVKETSYMIAQRAG